MAVLTYLFNECIFSNIFPSFLKLTKVIPIHKKGAKDNYDNYRPVSIIPTIGKIFEAILKNQIVNYFEKNFIFCENQYGFRSGHSTEKVIQELTHICINSSDGKRKINNRFYDLSKAFDSLSHEILLEKLKFYGFNDSATNFIKSYLSDRYQSVFYNDVYSQYLPIVTGVPQGSILGPALFIVYINDLPSAITGINTRTFLYADDLAVNVTGQCTHMNDIQLSSISDTVGDWCSANSLSLNTAKTEDLIIDLTHNYGNSVKFLGVHLESNLKWKTQINYICKKISVGIFILSKLKCQVNPHILRIVYFSYIHSYINYGILVWGNDPNVIRILKLQKKAVRLINGSEGRAHCKPIFRKLGILTVTSLYICKCLCFVKDNIESFSTFNATHLYNTRYNNNLRANLCRTSTSKNSFNEVGIKLYNAIPEYMKVLDTNKFKISVKNMLLDLCVYQLNEFFEATVY